MSSINWLIVGEDLSTRFGGDSDLGLRDHWGPCSRLAMLGAVVQQPLHGHLLGILPDGGAAGICPSAASWGSGSSSLNPKP